MKTLKLLLIATLFVVSVRTNAQATVSFNFGTPPTWAPKNAEPAKYYYLPEIQTYYDVPSKRYIYMRNGSWFRSAALPAKYRSYNLYKGQTVYLTNYKGNYPYYYFNQHKVKYNKGNNKVFKQSNGNHKENDASKSNGNKKNNIHDNGNQKNHGNKNGKNKK